MLKLVLAFAWIFSDIKNLKQLFSFEGDKMNTNKFFMCNHLCYLNNVHLIKKAQWH